MILVYITCKSKKEAVKIAKALLNKRLIACANLIQSDSLYRWDNQLQHEHECIIVAKTQNNKFYKVKKVVKIMHSYKIPCILKINAKPNKEYKIWVKEQLKPRLSIQKSRGH